VYSRKSGTIIMTPGCHATKNGTLIECTSKAEDYYELHRRLAEERRNPPRIKPHGIKGTNPNCPDCIQASQLPKLSALQLKVCQGGVVRSIDDGTTWGSHELMNVSNSVGPHYAGGGLNHGIQIQSGPHAGRLALARRFDCPAAMGDHGDQTYFHDTVLYSDDDGVSWAVGELLPQGWTETQVAEMKNGSLLLTTRTYGTALIPDPENPTDLHNKRRGFARSDDGGETWAEVWYVIDRQPEIGILQPTCAQALVSDPEVSNGTLYWAHPGNDIHTRANYTLHSSQDSGASWQFENRIYPGGAGYSDAHVLHDGNKHVLAMAFQKTFDCPTGPPASCGVPGIEGGGYDIALALYPI